jgi:restriction system protein
MKEVWGVQGNVGDGAQKFLDHSVIGVGWPRLGDLSKIPPTLEAFREQVEHAHPSEPDWNGTEWTSWIGRSTSLLFRFVHEVKVGDFVILPTTQLDNFINIGTITGPYRKDSAFDKEYTHLHPVRWLRRLSREALTQESKKAVNIQSSFCRLHALTDEIKTFLVIK